MRTYGDLLNVYPKNNRCYGYAPSTKRQCENRLNPAKIARAESLLYQMDRRKSVSSKHLRGLAEAMLCARYHNNITSPHLSQVDVVFAKWSAMLRESEKERSRATISVKREKPKQSQPDDTLETAKKLRARMEASDRKEKPRLDSEKTQERMSKQQKPVVNLPNQQSVRAQPKQEDPFVSLGGENSTKGTLFLDLDIPTQSSNESGSSRSAIKDVSDTTPTKKATANSVKSSNIPAEELILSPLSTPPVSTPAVNTETDDSILPAVSTHILIPVEEEKGASQPRMILNSQHDATAQPPIQKSSASPPSSSFTFRVAIPQTPPSFDSQGTAGQRPLPTFNLDLIAAIPSTPSTGLPQTPTPAQRFSGFSVGSLPQTPSKSNKEQTNETRLEDQKSSTAEPSSPETPVRTGNTLTPKPDDIPETSAPETPVRTSNTNTPKAEATPKPSEHAPIASEPPNAAPAPTAAVPITMHSQSPDSLLTPPLTPQGAWGHVTITPTSSSYKTYLPSRQQYGLMTPPQSSESISISTAAERQNNIPSPLPRPRVERKPLPESQPVVDVRKEVEAQGVHVVGEAERGRRVKSEYFSMLRIRSLRRRVGRRIRVLTGRETEGVRI